MLVVLVVVGVVGVVDVVVAAEQLSGNFLEGKRLSPAAAPLQTNFN